MMTWLRRIAPALLLLVLAPLTAEFLLGDVSVRSLPLLLIFLPQYGGGALLIRELARRTGRGWPTMLLLALAYGLVEEGLTTQSLFNPNYVGQHLLQYGYVSVLGTSLNWAVFVLTIHVVWSISTPILIAEGVAGARRTTPWLGRPGVGVAAALFVVGCAITVAISLFQSPFVAPLPQLLAAVVLAAAAVAVGFGAFRAGAARARVPGWTPPVWLAGLLSLALASAFELVRHLSQSAGVPAVLNLLAMLACALVAVVVIGRWSRTEGWGPAHLLALAAGTILTYGWVSTTTFLGGRTNIGDHVGALDVAGQVLEVLIVLGLIAWGLVRGRRAPEQRPGAGAGAEASLPA